jgi:hypothetical protein
MDQDIQKAMPQRDGGVSLKPLRRPFTSQGRKYVARPSLKDRRVISALMEDERLAAGCPSTYEWFLTGYRIELIPSGDEGAVIFRATSRKPNWCDYAKGEQYKTRLAAGWSAHDLHRAICRANGWAVAVENMMRLREDVAAEADVREVDLSALDVLEAEIGLSDFAIMTEEMCIRFKSFLQSMPLRAEE